MLTDTHSHIYSEEYNGEIDEVVKRAVESGVEKIVLPNIDSSSIKKMLDLSDKYPDVCFPLIGIHPTSVKEDFEEELEVVEFWLNKRPFYGIGEIGIDLYWDKTFREEQEYVFKRQLKLAEKHHLPVSIHLRESYDVVLENVKAVYYSGMSGVFHCFSGTYEQAREVIDLGFKIGVGGTVTFKNSGVDMVLKKLRPEDIILETDSPYLAPVPFRGKRNESANLVFVAKKVAEIFNLSEEEIASITSKNAAELFRI
ncbi:MAG TPA: TatD family hydrolase [Prolixibacteraceae bacterium]|nr:TatD family hydrolase [Prolixibacteraceae bacterium]HPS12210.1 TatD family hydrolase [Prolixibacteraceae bacterium]